MNYILVAIAIFAVWLVASLFLGSRIGRFIAENSVVPQLATEQERIETAARFQ